MIEIIVILLALIVGMMLLNVVASIIGGLIFLIVLAVALLRLNVIAPVAIARSFWRALEGHRRPPGLRKAPANAPTDISGQT
jgi:hypothetical protein